MEYMNAVDSKIRAYVRFIGFYPQYLEAKDKYLEALLQLYEHFFIEPDFLNNVDSYNWCYAASMMKNYFNHKNNMYVKCVIDLQSKKDDEYPTVLWLAGFGLSFNESGLEIYEQR